VALQALLEAQQRQNELLKQSLQLQQPLTSFPPHPASLQTPAAVTVSQQPTTYFSPTVVTVGNPRPPEPFISTTQRAAAPSHAVASFVNPAARDLSSQRPALVAAGVTSIDGAMLTAGDIRASPGKTQPTQRINAVAETNSEPAVQVLAY